MKLPHEVRIIGEDAAKVRLPATVAAKASARDAVLVLRPDTIAVSDAAAQIPDAHEGALFIHPDEARPTGFLGRLRPRKTVPRAVRASALLECGYVDIGAGDEDGIDWVWGLCVADSDARP